MPKVTLEQWRMLKAVAEAGGFAKAAENVHKSASSINHAVQKLQQQLGLPLLEVRGRRTEPTPAGEALLRRAEQLLKEAVSVEELAEVLSSGIQTELSLAVDQRVPSAVVTEVLHDFSSHFPWTRVQLYETVLEGGPSLLESGDADLLVGPNWHGSGPPRRMKSPATDNHGSTRIGLQSKNSRVHPCPSVSIRGYIFTLTPPRGFWPSRWDRSG